jgi:hypothetical protein
MTGGITGSPINFCREQPVRKSESQEGFWLTTSDLRLTTGFSKQ